MKCFAQNNPFKTFGSVKDYDLIISSLLVYKYIKKIPTNEIDHIIDYFEFQLKEAKKLRGRKRN